MSSQFSATLIRAADVIERDAVALKECHQTKDGWWEVTEPADVDALHDYKEGMALAGRLRTFAEVKG